MVGLCHHGAADRHALPFIMMIRFALPALVWVMTCPSFAGTVAWFYALESDKAAFEISAGKAIRSVTSGSVTFHEYRMGPHKVVAAKMGSGCVATATTVSTVLALAPADRLISTGPAGALKADVETDSWLRVDEVIAWQKDKAGENGTISAGETSTMSTGFDDAAWPAGEWRKARGVRIASGEGFIASAAAGSEIAAATDTVAVEMNAFGLMGAVAGRPLKLLILRVVSDRADERASEDFAAFVKMDDGAGGRMVAEIVKALPVEANEPAAHEGLRELLEK
jgi:nucleoside phosphorylase